MKGLRPLVTPPSYFDRYQQIVISKKDAAVRARLTAVNTSVAARFTDFERAVANTTLHSVREDAYLQRLASELSSCYGNKTKKLKNIFDGISGAQVTNILERCPYCGITLPQTHDHYLPQSHFPEFSAHALNLVPCCHKCNSTKGNRWRRGDRRMFLHFYSDPFPQHQYLSVNIVTRAGARGLGAQYTIHRPAAITNNELWSLIETHFDELDLLERYNDQANNEISTIFDICVAHFEDDGGSVSRFLNAMSRRNGRVFGVNHWRVVLWQALSNTAKFIAEVELEVGI